MKPALAGGTKEGRGSFRLSQRRERWGLTLLLLFLFFLLVFNLSQYSLHLDEISSYINSATWGGLQNGLQESGGNRILFYLLLNRWLVLGDQAFWQRLLSTFFAFLSFPLFYRLARRLMPPPAALFALFLFGTNAVYLDFSRLSRNYALAIFFVILSYYLLLTLLQRIELGRPARPIMWVAYAICNLLLLLSHPVGLFALVAQAGMLLFFPLLPRPFPWRPLIFSGLSVILTFFLLPILFGDAPNNQLEWLQIPDGRRIINLLILFLGGTNATIAVIVTLICGIVLLFPRFIRKIVSDRLYLSRQWPLLLILSWLLINFGLMLLVTYLYQPIFQPRYLLLLLPAAMLLLARLLFSIGIGIGVGRNTTKSPVLALSLGAVLSVLLILRAFDLVVTLSKPRWEEAVSWVMEEGSERDAVVFFDYHGQRVYRYHEERLADVIDGDGYPQIIELSSEPYHPGGGSLPAPFNSELLQSLSTDYAALWFVVFNNNIHGEQSYSIFLAIQQEIEKQYDQVDGSDFDGPFVARYQLKSEQ